MDLRPPTAGGERRVLVEIKRSNQAADAVAVAALSADARTYAATVQRLEGTLFVVDRLVSPGKK